MINQNKENYLVDLFLELGLLDVRRFGLGNPIIVKNSS